MLFPASLLVWITLAWGQVQAPVVWGEARWIGVGCSDYGEPVLPLGDTLIFSGRDINSLNPDLTSPRIAYSHDNGYTANDWMSLDTTYFWSFDMFVVGSPGSVFFLLHAETADFSRHFAELFRSQDAGRSWNMNLPETSLWSYCIFSCGQQVIRITETQTAYFADISNDDGNQWIRDIPVGPNDVFIYGKSLVATQNHFILLGSRSINRTSHVYCASSDRNGLLWTPFIELPGQPFVPQLLTRTIAGDTSSETAIAAMAVSDWGFSANDIYIYRTTNGGGTWEFPRALTEGAPLYYLSYPVIFNRGSLFGVAYQVSYASDSTQNGLYWRLSANHGKDWYPAQRVDNYHPFVVTTSGQFCGGDVRLYWQASTEGQEQDYRTASGVMTCDTLIPVLTGFPIATDSIHAGDTLLFAASASDNDTLSAVRVIISDSAGNRYEVKLNSAETESFQGTWIVPSAGQYEYSFRAEDFWENRVTLPDSGLWRFRALPSAYVSDDQFSVHPSSFILSCFPNPFNSSTRISFTLPKAERVDLEVYDVTGRKTGGLLSAPTGVFAAGENQIVFDGGDLPSGIYFVRVEAGEYARTQKIVLLK
jgi:hypothetical protein